MTLEPLVVEAKTLNFVEIDAGRCRRHVERRVSDNRLVAEVLGRKECELLFAKMDAHLALCRLESPGQVGCNIAIELDGDGPVGNDPCIGNGPLCRSAESRGCARSAVEPR